MSNSRILIKHKVAERRFHIPLPCVQESAALAPGEGNGYGRFVPGKGRKYNGLVAAKQAGRTFGMKLSAHSRWRIARLLSDAGEFTGHSGYTAASQKQARPHHGHSVYS